ncbi:MAG: TonB-dependent receptor [Planctomycetota bacterium]
MTHPLPFLALLVGAIALLTPPSAAQGPVPAPGLGSAVANDGVDLTDLSLEDLMDIEVTIATRSEQSLSELPAAVYVLTGDEIRRSGHSSIPEALRMVPGFYVSHWTTDNWDVTSRGFGPGLSSTSLAYLNQLLVMIDGIVVYSPLFAGTWWALQDIDLADVDRIEIVRGPGGILWGSNAVHGVVHVITLDPSETQGKRITARAANDDRHASARYGGTFGENGRYRAWLKVADYDTASNPFEGFGQDWNLNSAGFRTEWSSEGKDFTVWTRAYEGRFEDTAFDLTTFLPFEDVADKRGFQLYWSMEDAEAGSHWHTWFTTNQQDIPTLLDLDINTVDFEYNRNVELDHGALLTVGGGYRLIDSRLQGDDPFFLAFEPEDHTQSIFRAFALTTTEITDNLTVMLGLAGEHNDATGFELQPTARATWTPSETAMMWASASRAVRTPSLEERFLSPNSATIGDPDFLAEVLFAYEIGARALLSERVSADLALFYNDYENLHFADLDPVTFQQFVTNDAEGHGYGAELALDIQPISRWSLRSAYSFLYGEYEANGVELPTEDQSPRHIFNLRSYLDLGDNWELDSGIYAVEDLGPGFEGAEYVRADVRVGWSPSESLDLFAGVQRLTDSTQSEFDDFDNPRRAFFFGATWRP